MGLMDKLKQGRRGAEAERGSALAELDGLSGNGIRNDECERRLVELRHEAFAEIAGESADPPPEAEPELLDRSGPLASVAPDQLSAGAVRAGIEEQGCLYIPGLIEQGTCRELVETIDAAFEAAASHGGSKDDDSRYYAPFRAADAENLAIGRRWTRDLSSVWAADSPAGLTQTMDAFSDAGLPGVIADYLGGRAAFSVNKCTLRKVEPPTGDDDGAGAVSWHQDGSFLGTEIRALNVWVALTPCGEDAPGLSLVPRRLDGLVDVAAESAEVDIRIAPTAVEEVAGDRGILRPRFQAGDVMLFDELFLHSTSIEPGMTRPRYAIESWFFSPSAYPDRQTPLVL